MNVTVIGTGMGTGGTMTLEAWRALEQADCIIGARRLVEGLPQSLTECRLAEIREQPIADYLRRHQGLRSPCVVMSGDTGFYSGARRLLPLLSFCEVRVLPGISSPQYLASRLGIPWQGFHLVSAHGLHSAALDPAAHVRNHEQTFFLTGGQWTVRELCRALVEGGLGEARVTVGENLSYENERIVAGRADELCAGEFAPLAVMLVCREPDFAREACVAGIDDEQFIRGKAPMTKSEVRAVSLGKLALRPGDTLWDVGAGTGSVSVEAALLCRRGRVYAVECEEEAFGLLLENKAKFGVSNLFARRGLAPQALEDLPPPDALFIGGSKGNLMAILRAALAKNPCVRVVINAIALETLAQAVSALGELDFRHVDIAQIAVSRAKAVGPYHMMMGQNPVYVISGEGNGHA